MSISDSEAVVMEVLWQRHPLGADEVVALLAEATFVPRKSARVTEPQVNWPRLGFHGMPPSPDGTPGCRTLAARTSVSGSHCHRDEPTEMITSKKQWRVSVVRENI